VIEHQDEPPTLESLRTFAEHGSFEESLHALEAAVAHLEQGRLSLADAMAWYEIGLALAARCSQLLAQAELQVRSLDDSYRTFESAAQDWDDDEA
jgi:exodeoxyribonuclease VII small subunit